MPGPTDPQDEPPTGDAATPSSPRLPRRRSDRSRRAILEATGALLAEAGYAKLTIEGIAARAGVGKQTIYRWWPSKGAVVFDALLDGDLAGQERPTLPDTGDLSTDLRGVMRATAAALVDPATDALQRTLTAEIQHDPVLATELVERLLRPQMAAFERRLRSAQEAGALRADADLALAVELLLGPLLHRWLLRTGPVDDAYAERLVEHALAGLAPR